MKPAIFSHFPGVLTLHAHRVGKMGHNATATLCNGLEKILREGRTPFFIARPSTSLNDQEKIIFPTRFKESH